MGFHRSHARFAIRVGLCLPERYLPDKGQPKTNHVSFTSHSHGCDPNDKCPEEIYSMFSHVFRSFRLVAWASACTTVNGAFIIFAGSWRGRSTEEVKHMNNLEAVALNYAYVHLSFGYYYVCIYHMVSISVLKRMYATGRRRAFIFQIKRYSVPYCFMDMDMSHVHRDSIIEVLSGSWLYDSMHQNKIRGMNK